MSTFAARRDDTGGFRICIRRGRIIRGQEIELPDGRKKYLDIKFKSFADAKACSDHLNSSQDRYTYLPYISDNNIPNGAVPVHISDTIMKIIMEHVNRQSNT